MTIKFWVNIGLSNGLLPDVTDPVPAPVLTYHHSGFVSLH